MFTSKIKNKSVYLVTHKDLDGVACLINAVFLDNQYNIFKGLSFSIIQNSGFKIESLSKRKILLADLILFTDISPDPSVFEELKSMGKEYVLVDHHSGVLETFSNILTLNDNYFYSENDCGAKLLLNLFKEEYKIKPVLEDYNNLTSIYDTWQKENPLFDKGKNLSNSMFGFLPYALQGKISDEEFYSGYIKYMLVKLDQFKGETYTFGRKELDIIASAKEKEQKYLKQVLKDKKDRIDNEGNFYCYFEAPSKISYIANEVLIGNENYKYVVCRSNFWKNKDLKFSLRSVSGRMDVSKIAQKWGGNGHEESAGVDLNDFEVFEKIREGKIHLL